MSAVDDDECCAVCGCPFECAEGKAERMQEERNMAVRALRLISRCPSIPVDDDFVAVQLTADVWHALQNIAAI